MLSVIFLQLIPFRVFVAQITSKWIKSQSWLGKLIKKFATKLVDSLIRRTLTNYIYEEKRESHEIHHVMIVLGPTPWAKCIILIRNMMRSVAAERQRLTHDKTKQ